MTARMTMIRTKNTLVSLVLGLREGQCRLTDDPETDPLLSPSTPCTFHRLVRLHQSKLV